MFTDGRSSFPEELIVFTCSCSSLQASWYTSKVAALTCRLFYLELSAKWNDRSTEDNFVTSQRWPDIFFPTLRTIFVRSLSIQWLFRLRKQRLNNLHLKRLWSRRKFKLWLSMPPPLSSSPEPVSASWRTSGGAKNTSFTASVLYLVASITSRTVQAPQEMKISHHYPGVVHKQPTSLQAERNSWVAYDTGGKTFMPNSSSIVGLKYNNNNLLRIFTPFFIITWKPAFVKIFDPPRAHATVYSRFQKKWKIVPETAGTWLQTTQNAE